MGPGYAQVGKSGGIYVIKELETQLEGENGDEKHSPVDDQIPGHGAQDDSSWGVHGPGIASPVEHGVVTGLFPIAQPSFQPGEEPGQGHAGEEHRHDLGRLVQSEKGGQSQSRAGCGGQVRRDVCPGRNEVEPEQFEEDGDVEAGGILARGRTPEAADDQRAFKKTETQRRAALGEQGKKKRPQRTRPADAATARTSEPHLHGIVGNAAEVEFNALPVQVAQAALVFNGEGYAGGYLPLAGTVVDVADIQHVEPETGIEGAPRIGTTGK